MPFDLAEPFILEAERQLGASLPVSYKTAMSRSNGGEIEAADDVWQLHPIADTSDRKRLARTANHIIRQTASLQEWSKFPAGALAIGASGSGDCLVFLRGANSFGPAAHLWSHETGQTELLAEDFNELHGP
jgi:hypothetical protein